MTLPPESLNGEPLLHLEATWGHWAHGQGASLPGQRFVRQPHAAPSPAGGRGTQGEAVALADQGGEGPAREAAAR